MTRKLPETVYLVSGFEERRGVEAQAPWFVLQGTGNLDRHNNWLSPVVVAGEDVWQTIQNFPWLDAPYVVVGYPANSQVEAEEIHDIIMERLHSVQIQEEAELTEWENSEREDWYDEDEDDRFHAIEEEDAYYDMVSRYDLDEEDCCYDTEAEIKDRSHFS